MKIHKLLILNIILVCPLFYINGQNNSTPIRAFKLQNYSGEIRLDSYYNYKTWDRVSYEDKYRISYVSPAINLKTKSYIWHPNLLSVDFKAYYNPKLRTNIADINPDRVERITQNSFDLSAKLLQRKKIRLYSNFRINDGYYNDEDVSISKSNSKYWDAKLIGLKEKYPFLLTYSNVVAENENVTSKILHRYDTKRFIGRINKTFYKHDTHRLQYTYTDDKRMYGNLIDINTIIHDINLNNRLFFDKKNNYLLNSTIRNYITQGFRESVETSAIEKFKFKFPAKFELGLDYEFRNYSEDNFNLVQNEIYTYLSQELYKSLTSTVFCSANNLQQTLFEQQIVQIGAKFNYVKKIPTGNIVLNYFYANESMTRNNEAGLLQVVNEQHTIRDGEILLLNNPFIDRASIVVKSMNQILIYQENIDYYLIDQSGYTEIQRIPGGQLNNNSVIYVDYTANIGGTSSYNLHRHNFSARVSVLKQLVSVFYEYREDLYYDTELVDLVGREQFKEHVGGVESRSKYHRFGIDYTSRKSSLIPVEMLKYYATLKIRYKKLGFFTSVSHNYYFKHGIFKDLSYFNSFANMIYTIGSNTKIEYSFNYRKHDGNNIYLDLVKSKLEYSSKIRALSYSFGLEYFHKNMLLDKMELAGVFVKIKRTFRKRQITY